MLCLFSTFYASLLTLSWTNHLSLLFSLLFWSLYHVMMMFFYFLLWFPFLFVRWFQTFLSKLFFSLICLIGLKTYGFSPFTFPPYFLSSILTFFLRIIISFFPRRFSDSFPSTFDLFSPYIIYLSMIMKKTMR